MRTTNTFWKLNKTCRRWSCPSISFLQPNCRLNFATTATTEPILRHWLQFWASKIFLKGTVYYSSVLRGSSPLVGQALSIEHLVGNPKILFFVKVLDFPIWHCSMDEIIRPSDLSEIKIRYHPSGLSWSEISDPWTSLATPSVGPWQYLWSD